jgi:hypothetical protein
VPRCQVTVVITRELRVGVRAARRWLSAWAEVVGIAEGRPIPPASPLTPEDLELLRLAVEALEVNPGRVDEREALRRAAVFLNRPTAPGSAS